MDHSDYWRHLFSLAKKSEPVISKVPLNNPRPTYLLNRHTLDELRTLPEWAELRSLGNQEDK
jgi:hypothetical protein